ncbi:MAG TPA: hypothetical protein VHL54_03030, partial [Actinomycetota bacterium]|nr:hypothetical protein [Actinomycetota bacterium]
LVDTFGAERYWEFYRTYAEVPAAELYERLPVNTTGPEGDEAIEELAVSTTGASLQRLFDLDQGTLDRAVREWMAAEIA